MARTASALRAATLAVALLATLAFAICGATVPARGMEGALDGTAGGALVVSFDPGAADAEGHMEPIFVDADGTWYVPACCYVRDGLVPDRWLATGADGACADVAIGSEVTGLVADPATDGGCEPVDLSGLVEHDTLRLVALWRDEDAPATPDEAACPDDADTPGPEAEAPLETAPDEQPDAAEEAVAPLPEPTPAEDPDAWTGVSAPAEEPVPATPVGRFPAGPGTFPAEAADDAVPAEAGTWPLGEKAATDDGAAQEDGPVLRAASGTDPAVGTPVAVFCTEDRAYPAGTLVITRTTGTVQEDVAQEVLDTCGNELFGPAWTDVECTTSLTVPWAAFADQILSVTAVPGTDVAPASVSSWFEGCGRLASARLASLDLSGCTDLSSAFSGCKALTEVDAGSWDLSGATTLADLFRGCGSLAELDVSGWDVRRVTTLSHAFDGCTSLGSLDVSAWDTRRLRTATAAFQGCASLRELDVRGLRMSAVTSASSMFKGCRSITGLDLSTWSTPRLRNASHLLEGCASLRNVDLAGLDTHACATLTWMLAGCASLGSVDVSGLDVSAATDLQCLFEGCASLATLDLSGWDTSRCANLSGLLSGCDALEEADLSGIDTTAATDLSGMLPQSGALLRVTFGARASLAGAAQDAALHARMAPAPASPPHTGRWENAATGTCLTAQELQALDSGGLAGTWEWEVGFLPLSLDAAGGTWPEGTEPPVWYAKGAVTPLPGFGGAGPAPVRSGHALAGWLDESGSVVTEIAADSAGPRALSAVWEVRQVRMRVPVALTLWGTPTPTGVALALPEGERPLVENLGTTAAQVSAAITPAPEGTLALSVAVGDGGAIELAGAPRQVATVEGGEALAVTGVSGVTGAPAHMPADVPIGTICWTFTAVRGGEGS